MSNISLILSQTQVEHANIEYLGQTNGVYLYRVISRMGYCIEVELLPDKMTPEGYEIELMQGDY